MPGIPSADQVDITFIGNATLLVRDCPETFRSSPRPTQRAVCRVCTASPAPWG